jgi:hypothetical protein
MYSHCLVCNAGLGTNESIEHFQVGTRLAFDAAKGLLWVVCRACERWNLTPLEERWEAIHEAERLYRDVRTRVSTDNIGLARLKDGTELVRIGKPLKPELAAWRYGDQFGRRRRRSIIKGGVAAATVAGAAAAIPTLGIPVAALGVLGFVAFQAALISGVVGGSGGFIGSRWMRDAEGRYLLVGANDLANIRIAQGSGGPWELRIGYLGRYDSMQQWREQQQLMAMLEQSQNSFAIGEARVGGEAALDIARTLLPRINGSGARREVVQDAVGTLSELGAGADAFANAAARIREFGARQTSGDTGALAHLPAEVKLALEMAAFEDQERLALEGELAGLERAWREADELAGIADRLLEPPAITDALARMKGKAADIVGRKR